MALFKRLAETQRPAVAFTLDGQPATGSAITSADTAAIIGSMDSVAYTYMRTGRVCVAGELTKIDSVTSSKLLMNANNQPPATPCRIIGKVIWRNSVKRPAPSDSAACSALRSMPIAAASTRRSTYGVMITTWASISQVKLPFTPISANSRSIATPSTRCGMMKIGRASCRERV